MHENTQLYRGINNNEKKRIKKSAKRQSCPDNCMGFDTGNDNMWLIRSFSLD